MTRSTFEIEAAIGALDRRIATIATEARDVFHAAGLDVSRATAQDFQRALERFEPGHREADRRYREATNRLLVERDALRAELLGARHTEILSAWQRGQAEAIGTDLSSPRSTRTPSMTMTHPIDRTRAQAERAAFQAVEAHVHLPSAQDRLDRVIRDQRSDPTGVGPAYLAAVADPAYLAAFGKILVRPDLAHLEMDDRELAAVRGVRSAVELRAAALGIGNSGGFAVPFTLDPTIMLVDDGAVSPLRRVARAVTISTNEWRGISSDAVEATYQAEFAEVSDDTPTLAQPSITVEKAQAWIEFSIELGMDWPGASTELARLLAAGKDNVEAVKFVLGDGHAAREPQGLLTGIPPASVVGTTVDLDTLYAAQASLPPRYSPAARWLMNIADMNAASRLVASGDADEPQVFSSDGSRLLRKPVDELSTLPAGHVVYGDIRAGFTIVDRIGMEIELVPHLMGPNRRPTGTRGLYAYWRNSSAVLNPGALRAIIPSS